jgi:hypothetical protein
VAVLAESSDWSVQLSAHRKISNRRFQTKTLSLPSCIFLFKSSGGVVLEDDPEGVDHARDEGKESEEDVDKQVAAAATLHHHRDWREEECAEQGAQPAAVSHPGF